MNKEIKFWKMQSIGNDFPLIHFEDVSEENLPELAIQLCERRISIGGDGILVVKKIGENHIELKMFNPDGSEDFCGNGLRCAALHAKKMEWVSDHFKINHLDEVVDVSVKGDWIVTEIGSASYEPSFIPAIFEIGDGYSRNDIYSDIHGNFSGSALTTGSTHVVMKESIPSSPVFEEVSSAIENDPRFPHRTSVIWREKVGDDAIKIRIWERGVGETLGCGTGSAAAAVETMRERGVGGTIEVRNPGGKVWVSAKNWDSPIFIRGQAMTTFEGFVVVKA